MEETISRPNSICPPEMSIDNSLFLDQTPTNYTKDQAQESIGYQNQVNGQNQSNLNYSTTANSVNQLTNSQFNNQLNSTQLNTTTGYNSPFVHPSILQQHQRTMHHSTNQPHPSTNNQHPNSPNTSVYSYARGNQVQSYPYSNYNEQSINYSSYNPTNQYSNAMNVTNSNFIPPNSLNSLNQFNSTMNHYQNALNVTNSNFIPPNSLNPLSQLNSTITTPATAQQFFNRPQNFMNTNHHHLNSSLHQPHSIDLNDSLSRSFNGVPSNFALLNPPPILQALPFLAQNNQLSAQINSWLADYNLWQETVKRSYNQANKKNLIPLKFEKTHSSIRFGNSNQLIAVTGKSIFIQNIKPILIESAEKTLINTWPGPLIKEQSSKSDVIEYVKGQEKITVSNNLPEYDKLNLEKSRIWQLLSMMIKQNGELSSSELAEFLISKNKGEFYTDDGGTELGIFRRFLLLGLLQFQSKQPINQNQPPQFRMVNQQQNLNKQPPQQQNQQINQRERSDSVQSIGRQRTISSRTSSNVSNFKQEVQQNKNQFNQPPPPSTTVNKQAQFKKVDNPPTLASSNTLPASNQAATAAAAKSVAAQPTFFIPQFSPSDLPPPMDFVSKPIEPTNLLEDDNDEKLNKERHNSITGNQTLPNFNSTLNPPMPNQQSSSPQNLAFSPAVSPITSPVMNYNQNQNAVNDYRGVLQSQFEKHLQPDNLTMQQQFKKQQQPDMSLDQTDNDLKNKEKSGIMSSINSWVKNKIVPNKAPEAHLPDDSIERFYYDTEKQRWVDKEQDDEQDETEEKKRQGPPKIMPQPTQTLNQSMSQSNQQSAPSFAGPPQLDDLFLQD